MFKAYTAIGTPLLTDPSTPSTATFVLENTTPTIANTLRRAILTETRSVGFRADLTDAANPGVVIRKNTSPIFNEMLAHRLTLLPIGVTRIDDFDTSLYEFVLRMRNETKGAIDATTVRHVTAADFTVRRKQVNGEFEDLDTTLVAELFPADPITKDTSLLVTLRPQWNPEQPPEELDLTAYPVIGTGRDHMGFCPVSQCSFGNTIDTDPVRQEQFFHEWLADYKKIADPSAVAPDVLAVHRKEWLTMAVQRCFVIDAAGQPNSFTFTVESVGIRPVKDVVAEGIAAVIKLLAPYADAGVPFRDIGVKSQPVDSRMNGVDLVFDGQEHTLGNLLQTAICEMYLDTGAADSPITYVGYKVRHPLHRVMTLRLGIRDGVTGDSEALARQIVADGASKAKTTFEELGRAWAALATGAAGAGGEAAEGLDG
jgi:DNA-directed RNA polymerase subunit L